MTQNSALSRRKLGLSLVAMSVAAGILPGTTHAASVRTITDCRGRHVVIPAAQRIACIGGTITETLYAFGRSQSIIGVDLTSTWPEQAQREKKNLGYMRAISAEGVLSLRPDLILAMNDSGPAAAMDQLAASGVPVVFVDATHSPEAIEGRTRFLAEIVDAKPEGERLCGTISDQFRSLALWRAAHPQMRRVLFVMRMTSNRPMAAGAGTAADAVIGLAGAINAGAGMQGYKIVDQENLVALRPDVILTMQQGGDAIRNELLADPGFQLTPAGKNRAIIAMEGERLLGFGPRTPLAALDLARLIETAGHPV
ncbi:heme/hemin ABC transporter substrate-binding protein [Gluconobacter potus]|uniref:heme/hemin ABC transporter substrate-binding protein n=1 Tax=Gluconobacter potus TaxID=2724927 RepID=UPI0039ED1B0E